MKNFKVITLILMCFFLASKAYSQGRIAISIGPAFPVSEFADDDIYDEGAGGAAMGFNLGVRNYFPFLVSGLELYLGLDVAYNGLKSSVKRDMEDAFRGMGLVNAEYKFSRYINIPFSAGLKYTYHADNRIGMFASTGLVWNFLNITNMEITANRQTIKTEVDLANNFGFKIGGGLIINQRFLISLNYFGLGTHDIKTRVTAPGFSQETTGELKIDLLTLTFGYRF